MSSGLARRSCGALWRLVTTQSNCVLCANLAGAQADTPLARRPSAGLPSGRRPFSTSGEPPLFDKILVANRGEIAIRVMRTARRLGIKTVAVYSEADANALHVHYADEAVCIGAAPSSASYLRADAILDVVQRTGAQAVHPGYGFLSENAAFAEALEQQGVEFIGPPRGAIAAMGDKVESKRIATAAGVHIIPGWVGEVRDADHAVQLAGDIGYPVMIKASAGGGGKGMRVVRNEAEVREGFVLCVAEALSSFGDARMLMERYIEQPRHIEIQLLGDKHGTMLWLPERECSIQRRNQKVVEEAPSPFTDPQLRRAMGEQAVALAQAVGYYSAGTLEFLVDAQRNFYFLEMNTRLQVEHPITEAITQLDLVEQMLRVAAGHKLAFGQEQASRVHGWAVECRVYAEDPAKNFMPSIGRLDRYIEPKGHAIRVDSGVTEGSEISMYYDPMIGKLVTQGRTRDEALNSMERALDSYVIRGVGNNLGLLRQVVGHAAFRAGDTNTAFLPQYFPQIFQSAQERGGAPVRWELSTVQRTVATLLAALQQLQRDAELSNLGIREYLDGQGGQVVLVVEGEGALHEVTLRPASGNMASVEDIAAGAVEADTCGSHFLLSPQPRPLGQPYCADLLHVNVDGQLHVAQVLSRGPRSVLLQYCGAQLAITVQGQLQAALQQHMPPPRAATHSKVLMSPMAGLLVSMAVKEGDQVLEGDDLAVVEAMKMRNALKASYPGTIKAVHVAAGDVVRAEQVILEFE